MNTDIAPPGGHASEPTAAAGEQQAIYSSLPVTFDPWTDKLVNIPPFVCNTAVVDIKSSCWGSEASYVDQPVCARWSS
jgi:hypothetical protein